jgi:hypothetical protein
MSDTTKKSIVINKSFLSGSDNSGTSSNIQNKKSKKNTRILSEEIIRPNKLKKILLDKINAKRKAENNSYNGGGSTNTGSTNGGSNKKSDVDVSKESKLFSSEFKKSLDFLDSYIGQRVVSNKNKNKNNTLKNQSAPKSTNSLNEDIIKSIHNNSKSNNNNTPSLHVFHPSNNIHQPIQTQTYIPQSVRSTQITQSTSPSSSLYSSSSHHHHQLPLLPKIHLQIPSKTQQNTLSKILPDTVPKINLTIGKSERREDQPTVYTELPPELQNYAPSVYNMSPSPLMTHVVPHGSMLPSSISLNTLPSLEPYTLEPYTNIEGGIPIDDIDDIGARDMDKIENINSETSLFPSSSTFSPVKLSDEAPYGCLKGGKKPTFRAYNKTIKNNIGLAHNDSETVYSDRQTKLRELQNKHGNSKHNYNASSKNSKSRVNDNENNADYRNDASDTNGRDGRDADDDDDDGGEKEKRKHDLKKTKVRRHLRKTITKKFKLGKQAGNIVGVLIKNNDTRKNIQNEHGLLKSKQLADIKKYLVEKNLIKIGSTAPSGIIRNIYEASMLTGEIENVGKGIGLHNFLEDKKPW